MVLPTRSRRRALPMASRGVCTVTSDAEVDTELAAPSPPGWIRSPSRYASAARTHNSCSWTTPPPCLTAAPARRACRSPMLSFNMRASSPSGWSQKLARLHNATVHCSPRCRRPLTATTSARRTLGSSASHSQAVPFSTDRSLPPHADGYAGSRQHSPRGARHHAMSDRSAGAASRP